MFVLLAVTCAASFRVFCVFRGFVSTERERAHEELGKSVEVINEETGEVEAVSKNEETGERVRGATERAQRAAIEMYARWEVERERTPVDRVVAAEFRSRRYLNSGERRWVSEALYGCVRFLRRQTWLMERLGLSDTPENRIKLWIAAPGAPTQEMAGVSVPANLPAKITPEAVAEAVAALPGAEDDPRAQITISLAFPDGMADSLLAQLGDEAVEAAQAFNEQAPTTLRVNPLRVSRAHLMKSLPEAEPTRYSPWGLELPRRVNVHDLPGFKTGWFEVQEEASQLVALLANPLPGQIVAEVGAGAGGKTLAMAALMENRGDILAIDTSADRLEELQRRVERGGVTCVETCQVGAEDSGKWQPTSSARRTINKVVGKADVVLVDAPCTGSGVLRRSPDTKWREVYLPDILQLQQMLLAQAAPADGTRRTSHLCHLCLRARSERGDRGGISKHRFRWAVCGRARDATPDQRLPARHGAGTRAALPAQRQSPP